jgi:GT2 family glycosyltransferase
LPKNIVESVNFFTAKNRVWYPIFFFLYNNKPTVIAKQNGEWEQFGSKGMLSCSKQDWAKIGGLNETYTSWGNEDTDLWERFHKSSFTIVRNRAKILHNWHSSHNPKYKLMNCKKKKTCFFEDVSSSGVENLLLSFSIYFDYAQYDKL